MFIELHLLQSFAPANLNRDDTGSPKDAIFGGYRRARISSQAFKAAIRREPVFAEKTGVPVGQRTKRMAEEIASRLDRLGQDKGAATAVAEAFAGAYVKKAVDKGKTNVLIYLSEEEFSWITEQLHKNWDVTLSEATETKPKEKIIGDLVKELVNNTKNRTSAPDIALFGRMLASEATTNIDAACQVAHALSTHAVRMEMDYYTAMDHLKPDDTAGADMVGFTSFNSACYYRYLRIDWRQLCKNLGWRDESDIKKNELEQARTMNKEAVKLANCTVEGFMRATMSAIPTGKQNAFGAQNCTNFAMAVARNDGKSWNLVNAFETPIKAGREPETGYIEPSIQALDDYWYDLTSFYDDSKTVATAVYVMNKHQHALNHLADHRQTKYSDWVNTIIDVLPQE
ncbi:MAG TPA: type I-E CRISPR-associated protein Cas7/Cse4/CasC [Caldilineaceae bacterium]|nr:type I-E CRISPR-associated protein Cas7/Cse4/CasC [Caldilineaceae bacterium]